MPSPPVRATFRPADLAIGARRALPIALSTFVQGVVFGVLATGQGIGVAETIWMSATLFAGAAQYVVVGLWSDPIPVGLLIVTATVVNVRCLLYSATLAAWFAPLTPVQRYGSAFFVSDETWALAVGEMESGGDRGAVLLGSGLALWVGWVGGTASGRLAGGLVLDPSGWGLDFVYVAVFVALLVSTWKGRSSRAPWAVAAAVSLVAAWALPGAWYVLLGGIAGGVVGGLRGDG